MKRYIYLFSAFLALLVFSCGEVSDFDKDPESNYDAMCGDKGYNSSEQFCLNDEIYSLCGGMAYDIDKYFCHSDGAVYSRCNGNMYNPGNYFCFDSKILPKCGNEIYNPKELFCDESILDTLCNGVMFKPKSEFCSHEDYKVHPFCDGERYNPEQEFCSDSEIYKICPSGNFSKDLSNCCSSSNSNCMEYQLCEKTKYDVKREFCDEKVVYQMCGGKPYSNPSNKFCSDGEAWELCRVQTGIDDYGRPIVDYFDYDPKTQKCGSNGIEDRYLQPQCSNLLATQFCCFGKAYEKTGDYFCVDDELYPKCSGKEYVPTKEGCFEGKLYPRCSLDSIVGTCVDNTVKRCKQLGSGRDHIVDPLPELMMTCNDKTGAVTGTSKSGGYKVAQIGNQVWLAENLKSDLSRSICYGNNCGNYGNYGRLYDWAAGMGIEEIYNYDNYPWEFPLNQGPCPTGFYLPRNEDWQTLVDYAGGASVAGGRLKSTIGWSGNGNGVDAYGFNALPGGSYNEIFAGTDGDGFEGTEGKISKWWSTTQHPNPDAYYWAIYSSDTEIRNFFQPKGFNKVYIRCVLYYKDATK